MANDEETRAALLKHLSAEDMADLLEIVSATLHCQSDGDFPYLFSMVKGLIACDASYWCPWAVDGGLQFTTVNVDFPDGWIKWYFENEYQMKDRVTLEWAETLELQSWSAVERKHGDPLTKMINGESRQFGLSDGFSGGICNADKSYGVLVSFAGEKTRDDPRTRTILSYITPHLCETLRRIHGFTTRKQKPRLTRTEHEVLLWIKEGKTSWEVSQILGRSESTVNFHVKNIVRKLGAANRSHAVAIAIEERIVPL